MNSNSARKNTHSLRSDELDETLHKLSEMAKDKVKISDFTSNDKANLLEIFVNNETIWLQIHDLIFPKISAGKGENVSELGILN